MSGVLILLLASSVGLAAKTPPAPATGEKPGDTAQATLEDPRSMATLSYSQLQPGGTQKWRFRAKDPQILAEGTLTHFKAFELPADGSSVGIKVETSTSFEVPNFPVKYLFCPKILLLDADFEIVYSSELDDLEKRQRLFGEPRFVFEHTVPSGSSKARYLVIIREVDFDGQYVSSIQPDDAPVYDELLRRRRERIYSSPTGPVRISLKN